MATRDSFDPQVQLKELGGLDQRPGASALPAPNFDLCHGVYQARAGTLQRLEGIEYCGVIGEVGETGFGAAVWSIFQPNDGTDNIIFHAADGKEYIVTLNQLFHRPVTNTLVYEPLDDDNDMPTAILVQTATNGTDLGSIGGASANTWYTRPLTANPLNEDSIVVAFDNVAFTFEIAPGTYRIRGYVTAAISMTVASGGTQNIVEGGFQAAINDTTNGATLAIGSTASWRMQRVTTTSTESPGPLQVISEFDDTFDIAGTNAVLNVQNAFSQTLSAAGSVSVAGGVASNVSALLNGAALAQYYVKLNLAKVA